MVQLKDVIIRDNDNYNRIASKLKETNDYALKCYRDIQNSIFVNGDDSYFDILEKFGRNVKQVKSDMSDKYATNHYHVHSEWRGPIVIGLIIFVIFYFVLATILSNVIVRVLIRKVKTIPDFGIQEEESLSDHGCGCLALCHFHHDRTTLLEP
jgi:hypothetical protein